MQEGKPASPAFVFLAVVNDLLAVIAETANRKVCEARVSSYSNHTPSVPASRSDEETVAALVAMLSGMGIDRARIDAMITKTSRPDKIVRNVPKAGNLNDDGSRSARRFA
ncbi:hypothetical protein [Aureimonas leprariae]|uniref:Uncharacterized protein n=1 Tax=Plantimonas leprariae TaxID=2615207 RepID=A0A7V7U1F8_9HYPH|nr:hypothetical protein [Aureimonas leprariae]KAB0681902.1 hypothetical protein F6X38_03530 [Aureimonas leprariae]